MRLAEKDFKKVADRVRLGTMSRTAMLNLRDNARRLLGSGMAGAQTVIDAINETAVPKLERQYAFLGFCTDGTLDSRLDTFWLKAGICKFDNLKSKAQLKRFSNIHVGDTIVLKKVLEWGVSIELFAYGEVLAVKDSQRTQLIYFHVDWHEHDHYLIVPAMGSRSTVDIRSLEMVEEAMDQEFWTWISTGKRVPNQWTKDLID